MTVRYPVWLATIEKANMGQDQAQDLLRLMDQIGVRISAAFEDAVRRIADRIDVAELERLIKAGKVKDAIDLVNGALGKGGFGTLAAEVSTATLAAGQTVSASIVSGRQIGRLVFAFNPSHHATVQGIEGYEMDLIRELDDTARASIKDAITAGVKRGINPRTIARDIRQFIGLTENQALAVINYRIGLENGDREVLNRALRDKRFDSSVLRAINSKKPLDAEKIDKLVERYASRYLNYRAETIARTEALRAVNRASYYAIMQMIDAGQIEAGDLVRKWLYTHDNRVRDAHQAIPAMNRDGVGFKETFKTPLGPLLYPGDPAGVPENTINCRCVVTYHLRRVAADPSA